ncbi:arylsulfatase [Mycolicibacterium sp. CAU 1645]|uniref:Arylsulfatase n=1 Tax=Mycolicibacterium arenosum TaxID=2952157 RepID=A0ABT1M221_9MYCO|nr:arylsulfatase [Mycolicibacterium sp. CAU 1645]MCP9272507.1 arylsulfatase [Mycolicibacterium sp. CAU 1645]
MPDIVRPGYTPYDAKDPNSHFAPIEPLRPPADAPNILLVMIDDAGYGASSAFGGPCSTPTLERLAGNGLRYTKFHTTALCSPTRAALLSGRNHHSVNMGAITEIATSAPGMTSARPNTCAALPEILKLNGYATAQIGKCHEVPVWETSPMGPFDHWPTPGGGFEYFFGFIGGETDQYYPSLYENTTPVEPSGTPEQGYTLNEEMADKAIAYLRRRAALTPDRPFFMYYAPGATHAPHHVPPEWADRYRGVFDEGWDKLRERILARQIDLGTIPAGTDLTARSEGLPAWDEMDDALKPVLIRQAEVYAGFMEQTDFHIGRVVDEIEEQGLLDDTLIVLIWGDNGASAEGTLQGSLNEMITLNGMPELETPEMLIAAKDRLGLPGTANHYAASWAHALNTPFQWTKQVASHFGGTRNPMVIHWPARITQSGIRHQFGHVNDIAATVLEAAGLPEPTAVNGVQQRPFEGTSLVYTFDEPDVDERHDVQYFEMLGNRGVYHKGWTAVTKHRTPWETGDVELPAFDEDRWELYDTSSDWSQAHDLAAAHPDKLAELQRLWLIEAVKYNVIPIDDRAAIRGMPDAAGRPELAIGTSQRMYPGMSFAEATTVNTKNRSFAITAPITVPDAGADGVIIALGGHTGGWSLYVHEGRLTFCYNFLTLKYTVVRSADVLAAGDREVRIEFGYDGGGVGLGGTVTLFVDGAAVGAGHVERTVPAAFSASETCTVGADPGSPVSQEYPAGKNRFTGGIAWVQIDVGDLDPQHLARQRAQQIRVAMGTQ